MPTISLCMIVRDEEAMLPDFLGSVAGCFDQFVAVDTGSRDGTVAILRGAGAEVHDMVWPDDFAAARNESLRHATGEWVLVLDADEFPTAGFRHELRAFVERPGLGAGVILRHDEQKNGIVRTPWTLRLFRSSPDIRYRCRIHEDASDSIKAMLARRGEAIGRLSTPVRHVGYRAERMDAKDKAARDERLLRLAVADDPSDLYSRYKLLELYRFWGNAASMAPVAAECRALIERGVPLAPAHIAGDLVEMMRAALYPGEAAAGLAFLTAMAPVAGHTGHYHLAVASLLEDRGSSAAAGHFARALELAPGDPAQTFIETRALTGLTRLALAAGDLTGAKRHAGAAFQVAPDDAEVQLAMQVLAGVPG
ncbi:glycosyltransferase family 2 protein [Blastochloris viridis]|nr:glycosyltransferase family 2 protein [Blastochloris viridis]ALK08091.1 SPBc2 prophage-derived glycosyltransferase SunS [Blastochloris viridis]CUU44013.1 SPBc2 prophage-derived glycosyltransferase SunS [Blastochloris viridis]